MYILKIFLLAVTLTSAVAQEAPPSSVKSNFAPSVVFIGNSYTYGYGSPVRFYRAGIVTDLNGDGHGGVPALFKVFALQAGRDFRVSLEPVMNFS